MITFPWSKMTVLSENMCLRIRTCWTKFKSISALQIMYNLEGNSYQSCRSTVNFSTGFLLEMKHYVVIWGVGVQSRRLSMVPFLQFSFSFCCFFCVIVSNFIFLIILWLEILFFCFVWLGGVFIVGQGQRYWIERSHW